MKLILFLQSLDGYIREGGWVYPNENLNEDDIKNFPIGKMLSYKILYGGKIVVSIDTNNIEPFRDEFLTSEMEGHLQEVYNYITHINQSYQRDLAIITKHKKFFTTKKFSKVNKDFYYNLRRGQS